MSATDNAGSTVVSVMKPGDILLVHSTGFVPRSIGFMERLRRKGVWSHWTHIAVITSETGDTIEAQAKGIVRSTVTSHPDRKILDAGACFGVPDENRPAMMRFAESCLGDKYGFLTIASIVGDTFTPHLPRIRSGDTLICSEFGARVLEHGGWVCPLLDTGSVEPSDLAYWGSHQSAGATIRT